MINATAGANSLEALDHAAGEALAGKMLLDVANPLEQAAGETSLTGG